jgi:hypothetical protein
MPPSRPWPLPRFPGFPGHPGHPGFPAGYGELFEYDSESGQLVLGSDPATVGV